MSDEFDSAFVEIAAGAPELDAAGDELVALYGDVAQGHVSESPPLAPARGGILGCTAMLLVVTVLALIVLALAATSA